MKRLCRVVLIMVILSTCRPWHGFAGVKGGDERGGDEDAIAEEATDMDEETIEEDAEDEEDTEQPEAALNFSAKAYTLAGFPRASSIVDIDSDEDLDVVVANPNNHNIAILLNKGDGTFEVGDSYPVEGYPIALASADIDNDGDIDIAVLDSGGMVRILKHGPEGFSTAGGYRIEAYFFSISLNDLDRDMDVDIIVSSAKRTIIFLNDGSGGFNTELSYKQNVTSHTAITADLNSDQKDDMVIGDKDGVSVLLNNGDNTFAGGVSYITGEMPIAVATGDLDSDGDEDIVVANYKANTISILRNNGDGAFPEVVNYPSGKGTNSISLEDIDMDEDIDVIVTNGSSGDISIFINNTVMPLSITTDSFPQGRNGEYYETVLEVKGGVPPYRWAVIEGALPPSLGLDPVTGKIFSVSRHGGEISSLSPPQGHEDTGGPLLFFDPPCYCLKAPMGLYRFTVQVADSSSVTASADLFIEVLPQPGTVSGTIRYSGEKRGRIRIGIRPQSQATIFGYSTTIETSGEAQEYKIENIYPESYLVDAFLDANGDGIRQMGEPYGVFGSGDQGGKSAPIVVDDGAALTGIDIELK